MPGVTEPVSLVNCREIEDWAAECREFQPPLISAVSVFGTSLGLFAGFLTGFASTSRTQHLGWWGALLFATALFGVIALGSFLYLVMHRWPWLRTKMGIKERATSLETLAEVMERAREAGATNAQAAEQAEGSQPR